MTALNSMQLENLINCTVELNWLKTFFDFRGVHLNFQPCLEHLFLLLKSTTSQVTIDNFTISSNGWSTTKSRSRESITTLRE